MRKHLIASALIFGTLNLFAFGAKTWADGSPAPVPPGYESHYTHLQNVFNQSQAVPDRSSIEGWFSGRCFSEFAQDKPEASLFLGLIDQGNDHSGPLFPPQGTFRIIVLDGEMLGAEAFDQYTDDIGKWVTGRVDHAASISPAAVDKGSWVGHYQEDDVLSPREVSVRQNDQIIVMKESLSLGSGSDADYYCYYFKKIHD